MNRMHRRTLVPTLFLVLTLIFRVFSQEELKEEKEAMEIGGSITVDAFIDPSAANESALEIGTVDLSANVNVAQKVVASITVSADDNLSRLFVDQALVAWQIGTTWQLLFGQQTYRHGLLSTHLISDPVITGAVELVGPGVDAAATVGPLTAGLGLTYLTEQELGFRLTQDSTITIDTMRSSGFRGLAHIDLALLDESVARLSVSHATGMVDLSVGTGLVFGNLSVDLELWTMLSEAPREAGWYVGAAYAIGDHLELALRYDGVSPDQFERIDHRVGGGATISFVHGIFAAVEYAHLVPAQGEASDEIALQLGLESTIKLPGYQRRTLIRN